MAITQYSELKTAVANWLERDDLTSRVPEFIAMAEDRIALDLIARSGGMGIRPMETLASITIDAETVSLPTGYLAARSFWLEVGSEKYQLQPMTQHEMASTYAGSTTGQPRIFAAEAETFRFAPAPDGTYTGKLLYLQKFTAMSADSDTNWLLTNARGLLLYGALIEAEPYLMNDARLATWGAQYSNLLEQVVRANRHDRFSGGPMIMRSGVMGA